MNWAQGLNDRIAEQVWQLFIAPIQTWFDQHVWLEWLLQHPLWLLGLLGLAIFLFAGLIQAIGRLTENIWLTLLLLPFRLLKWLVKSLVWLGQLAISGKPDSDPAAIEVQSAAAHPENRLQELLDRLDAIRIEEANLLQEVREILAAKAEK